MDSLAGKTALVTGASKGIGTGIAVALAQAGAHVAINYARDRAGADRTVAAIEAGGGRAVAIQADVSRPDDVARLVAETVAAFGSLDILVNNAAAYDMATIEEITPAEFHRHFDTNVLGPLLLTQHALKHFGPGASVLNISSAIVVAPEAGTSLYGASKSALNLTTEILSKELGPRQIRVNTIAPGVTHTDGHPVNDWDRAIIDPLLARTALGRLGTPDDIAPAAVFLASDAARWITGATFYISGGFR
ncbi:MAG: glucose 1-dehydrogenase [Sphingomonadales bacterium]|nr:glucose 1-dehydrogenase [Sphingomonadales bacterium]